MSKQNSEWNETTQKQKCKKKKKMKTRRKIENESRMKKIRSKQELKPTYMVAFVAIECQTPKHQNDDASISFFTIDVERIAWKENTEIHFFVIQKTFDINETFIFGWTKWNREKKKGNEEELPISVSFIYPATISNASSYPYQFCVFFLIILFSQLFFFFWFVCYYWWLSSQPDWTMIHCKRSPNRLEALECKFICWIMFRWIIFFFHFFFFLFLVLTERWLWKRILFYYG